MISIDNPFILVIYFLFVILFHLFLIGTIFDRDSIIVVATCILCLVFFVSITVFRRDRYTF